MAMQRISVDAECKDGFTCPSVWTDDNDPEYAIVVGTVPPVASVPLAPGEVAIRVRRQVIRDAADL
jgi:hypothetical protein